ncbi:MAG: glycine zipper family protein [Proteobacteria bacterium]|nr:glycine zipper family protein [Pseudomonadota bacterium]
MSVARAFRAPLAMSLFALGATAVQAQQGGAFVYPKAGQSEQQQSKDRYECHQWAVQQTGFDPSTAPPIASAPPPQAYGQPVQQQAPQQSGGGFLGIGNGGMLPGSGVMGDAATGAALGAAGGAIAGNAGQGAAIGAVASTLFGALNRATDKPAPPPQPQANPYQQQQQAAAAQEYNQRLQMTNDYNRAFGTCMSARNYTVN